MNNNLEDTGVDNSCDSLERLHGAIHNFLFEAIESNNTVKEEDNKCKVCLVPFVAAGKVKRGELSQDVINIALKALLVLPKEGNKSARTRNKLNLCSECVKSFSELADLFLEVERLTSKFKDLRRKLGLKVIFTALGNSKTEFGIWEQIVQKSEESLLSFFNCEETVKQERASPNVGEDKETNERVDGNGNEDVKLKQVLRIFRF